MRRSGSLVSSLLSGHGPVCGYRLAPRGRAGRLLPTLACGLLLVALPATSASASTNTTPSKAKAVKVGVPFTGNWPGSDASVHWWRLPTTLRPGDEVQLAVDTDAYIDLCLVPPIDDFDAADSLSDCRNREVEVSGLDRLTMPYDLAAGQPFLAVSNDSYCCSLEDLSGRYTITLERIVTLVNLGMAIPPRLPASFVLFANLTYGDNTPAADGTLAFLQWRYQPADRDNPDPFVNVALASSVGGVATFVGTMPPEAQGGTVQLRACVEQPGGDSVRCGASGQTTVAVSSCYRALQSRRVFTRVVRRLQRRLRRARLRNAGGAKRKLKRKLKVKRRRLARAKRSVKIHC